ncbi:hypothetical protein ACIGB8_24810 [Promicromonospora sukumoe]|uniref:hypothetical protein n=1 Tax=Promicromonospora sukumoe TaxID=88382 RepID=UPI0037C6D751
MLIQVRSSRPRAALLAATTCTLLIVSATAASGTALSGTVSGAAAAAVVPVTGSGPDDAAQAWSVGIDSPGSDDAGVRASDEGLRLDVPDADDPAGPAQEAGDAADASPGSTADREASGQLVDEPVDLVSPVRTVAAVVDAATPEGTSVLVDVRGRLAEEGPDTWTEWVPAGSPLPVASATVQARVTLVGTDDVTPTVREVTLTPEAARSRSLQEVETRAKSDGQSYRLFATREGLVGGTTANGHVITERDHFVALPSRRGLSSKGSGSYSVRVCAASTDRCAYAPVWDVGPWNTTDDHWSPSGTRQSWADLPQGKPQAQAAYQDGYNGGRDGFGRKVANPAGIDLGDGTFWDALGLRDNAWTTVTYLWTGSGPKGVVRTSGGPLTVRSGPSTSSAAVGQAGRYANVLIECTTTGTTVDGYYGTTNVWNRIGPGNWISDAYVNTGSSGPVAPTC